MSRQTTLQKAAGALSSIDEPFRVMTSLLFLVALASDRHSNVGMPAGAYWRLGPEPTGEQLNALLADLEGGMPVPARGRPGDDVAEHRRPFGAERHVQVHLPVPAGRPRT